MKRNKIIIKTSIQGIIMNLFLVVFKAIVGFLSNSIAIVLDALNNLSDALSAVITIIGTKLSAKKPDKEHPYGHGRIEYIASVIVAVIVLLAGIASIKESFEKVINPVHANYTYITLMVIIVAILVKFFFGKYIKNVGQKIDSQALIATGTDAFMDSILSLSTLVGAIISITLNISIEGYLGVIISIIIIKSSVEILSDTLNRIIGIRADSALTKKLKKAINSFEKVEGAYDLTLHNYGPILLIGTVHIQVNDNMTAKEIHILSRRIQEKILKDFGIVMTIGIYASNTEDKDNKKIKAELLNIIKKYKEVIQLHGFYVDPDKKLITFDIIVDFDSKDVYEVKENIIKEIKEKYPKYNYDVIIDRDFSD